MSGVVSSYGLRWKMAKSVAVTEHQYCARSGGPIDPKFEPPGNAYSPLSFSPEALAGAVARTATTRMNAPLSVLYALFHSVKPMLKILVEDGPEFELSTKFCHLADVERTFLAARVGAGITHLYMEALKYRWRANAECLSLPNGSRADFLYGGGSATGHGVVLVEAHGSFSRKVTENLMKYRSREKYRNQVKPLLGGKSCFGKLIHGYSIAFGSRPMTKETFICPTETKIPARITKNNSRPKVASKRSREPSQSRSIIMATYRSNFFLMGCAEIVGWIDSIEIQHSQPSEQNPVEFLKLEYPNRRFLVHRSTFYRVSRNGESRATRFCCFAIEEEVGIEFLSTLSKIISKNGDCKPDSQEISTSEPAGFDFGYQDAESIREGIKFQYAVFRDGMALLGNLNLRLRISSEIVTWYPMDGISQTRNIQGR